MTKVIHRFYPTKKQQLHLMVEFDGEDVVFPLETIVSDFGAFSPEGIPLIVEECKRDIGGPMWCQDHGEFVEKGDCGRLCEDYSPCNGKNGRCIHLKNGYMGTGKKYKLFKDGCLGELNVGE
jgi:hypothetical protein